MLSFSEDGFPCSIRERKKNTKCWWQWTKERQVISEV